MICLSTPKTSSINKKLPLLAGIEENSLIPHTGLFFYIYIKKIPPFAERVKSIFKLIFYYNFKFLYKYLIKIEGKKIIFACPCRINFFLIVIIFFYIYLKKYKFLFFWSLTAFYNQTLNFIKSLIFKITLLIKINITFSSFALYIFIFCWYLNIFCIIA